MSELPPIDFLDRLNTAFALLQQKLAPGKIAPTQKNIDALYDWTAKRYNVLDPNANAAGVAEVFLEATEALYFQNALEFETQPSKFLVSKWQQNIADKMKAAQIKKAQKEKEENSEAAFFARVKAAEDTKKKEAAAKKADVLKQAIHSKIMVVEIYSGPNRIDHTESEKTRQRLFNFVAHRRQQNVSDENILKELGEVTNPGVHDIKRELERRWDNIPDDDKPTGGHDSLGGGVSMVGRLGSLR